MAQDAVAEALARALLEPEQDVRPLEGFEERVVILPIDPGVFGSLGVNDEGALLYVRRPIQGVDDDFGLGSFGSAAADKPVEPGKQFAELLAGGPECGLHTVIWCDSYNNVERWFSRQSLRELEYRVAFQMNAADSSNLIDSAAASKLGVHRALLYREESGTSEKFRPYGAPELEWLRSLRAAASVEEEATPVADLDAFQVE